MANENEEIYYCMDFHLGGSCRTEASERNDVSLRSKKLDSLAEKLKLISDFRNNVFDVTIFERKKGKVDGLIYCSTIEEIENWFSKRGIVL